YQALLDLATNFLKHNPQKSQQSTILAIDEPELSLHATSCFQQFEKIKTISILEFNQFARHIGMVFYP
ncbi:hypothetical protein ACVYGM_14915, partial [Klebsiella pneumoniae]